jgi:hypothetical protein
MRGSNRAWTAGGRSRRCGIRLRKSAPRRSKATAAAARSAHSLVAKEPCASIASASVKSGVEADRPWTIHSVVVIGPVKDHRNAAESRTRISRRLKVCVVAHEQVANVGGDRKAVALARAVPRQMSRSMVVAGIYFDADVLQSSNDRLDRVGAANRARRPALRPIDLISAQPTATMRDRQSPTSRRRASKRSKGNILT